MGFIPKSNHDDIHEIKEKQGYDKESKKHIANIYKYIMKMY